MNADENNSWTWSSKKKFTAKTFFKQFGVTTALSLIAVYIGLEQLEIGKKQYKENSQTL